MNPLTTSAFDLPPTLAAKADPALIAHDERYFAAMAANVQESIADLSERLDTERRAPGRKGQQAIERDLAIHRLTARLRTLRRFGVDLCLGHMVTAENPEPVYVGRLGLTDGTGRRVLIDWRSPAAEPFFGATHADPMGLISRRRYRWMRGRITDYWDEVFTADGLAGPALDDQSAFIASLGSNRSERMRDVLGTIAADQDAIIRAGSGGALVVDGGPGTGKTVVALHRTAYLLYSDPRLGHRRGGVLFVGPHRPFLAYVADVLPSLGEEGVQICTLRDLVAQGATAAPETDPQVAELKSSARLVKAIEEAVGFYEEPPASGMTVETPWSDVWLSTHDWTRAFDAAGPGTPHNEACEAIWAELLTILTAKHDDDIPPDQLRKSLQQSRSVTTAFHRSWPIVEADDLVGDLWSVPAYLRRSAPWLDRNDIAALQRPDAKAWTLSDLPFLDAARHRLGDPEASDRRRRNESAVAADREYMSRVVEDAIEADDDDLKLMSMLRGADLREALVHDDAVPTAEPDPLAGPFAHIVVDEAQELTDAQWQMLLLRCPSRSLHHRRRPGAGPAWIYRNVDGTTRADRSRSDQGGLVEHQLPDTARDHARGRAGHPRRPPRRQRADFCAQQRVARHPRIRGTTEPNPGGLAHCAHRRHSLRDRCRRPWDRDPDGPATDPIPHPRNLQGPRVRPGGRRRPAGLRRRYPGSGRSLCRGDQGDPAARRPHEPLIGSGGGPDPPPSTGSTTPVQQAPPRAARNTTAPAMSSLRPMRPAALLDEYGASTSTRLPAICQRCY
ncbi:hypothetical protein ABIB25_001221 [Nakamurella sp. UYEF19]